jgi:glycosyltransferase involved in cell wall biosynthesis
MTTELPYDLTVVITSYNRRELLRRCLDSLAVQTLDDSRFEVLVLDDGSSDGTTEMVESLSTPYRLRLLSGKQRRWARARNAGVEVAEGRVCLHVDDDIICGAEMLAGHVAAHAEGERIVAIGKLTQAPPDADDWYAHAFAQGLNEHYDELLHRPPAWTDCYGANLSTTRAVYLEIGGFATDLTAAIDLEFGFRLVEAGCTLRYLPDADGIHDDQKLSQRMLEDAKAAGRDHPRVVEKHPSTESQMLDWVGPAGPVELTIRKALVVTRIPPVALAVLGRLLPGSGRKMIWLHFVRRVAFWRSVHENVDRARWRQLTSGEAAAIREPGATQSVP